jgi:mRNA-degrading endonuclease RelE of RelBE toxin-antitoxin system
MRGGFQVQLTEKFIRDYKSLPLDIQKQVDACIVELGFDPIPNSRRPHSVSAKGQKPTVYTVDVTSNKAYKLSFQVANHVAILRRVGTHKQLDRSP